MKTTDCNSRTKGRFIIQVFAVLLVIGGALPFYGLAQDNKKGPVTNVVMMYPLKMSVHEEGQTRGDEIKDGLFEKNNYAKRTYSPPGGFIEKKTIRDFALFSYSRLSNDIVNGSGLYLDTLYTLLGVEEKDKNKIRQDFVRILIRNLRIPEFAMEVAEYGQKK